MARVVAHFEVQRHAVVHGHVKVDEASVQSGVVEITCIMRRTEDEEEKEGGS